MQNSLRLLVACSFLLTCGGRGTARAAGSPETGLVLHYDFNRAEAPAADRSGNGYDGKILDAQWIPSGIGGGSLHLRGPLAQVTTTDAGMPLGDAPRSFSWWVALDSLSPSYSTEFLFYGRKTYNQMSVVSIDWRLGRNCPAFSQWGGVYLSGRRIDQVGVWNHLAFTYGGDGQYAYYINGERWHGYSELHGPIDTRPGGLFCIGCHSPGESHGLDGYIDEVRVYDRALTEEEVRTLFREGDGLAGQPAGGPVAKEVLRGTPSAESMPQEGTEPKSSPGAAQDASTSQPEPVPGKTGAAGYPAILRIGFSNHPEGDRDVTVFLPDEMLHVWVEDVDLGPWNTNILMRLTVSQRDDAGRVMNPRTADLVPDEAQVFTGQVSLDQFVPGLVQVDIVGVDRGNEALVLMRSSWLRIMAK